VVQPCRTTLHHDDDDDDDDDGGVPMLVYVAVCMELQHTHTKARCHILLDYYFQTCSTND